MKNKIIYLLFITAFTLLSAEVLLRASNKFNVWSEDVGKKYMSGYNQIQGSPFTTWPVDTTFEVDQKDFKYTYTTNKLGIRERNAMYTDTGAVRILCIGDSYTEGAGADYNESYPKVMERALNKEGFRSQVYNAGISGSDPFFGYMLYKDKLQAAQPRYVFITINASDITDYVFRGGMQRFKPDGTSVYRQGPWYEPLYEASHVFRFFINVVCGKIYRNLFVTQRELEEVYAPAAVKEAAHVFDSINKMLQPHGGELMVVIQAIGQEIAMPTGRNAFTRQALSAIEPQLEASGVKYINMYQVLEGKITAANLDLLTHKNDRHYTPAGYNMFATELLKAIDKKYPGYWKQ